MSSTNSPADVLTGQRRAILLRQLADAKGGELTLTKAIKVPPWVKKQLDFPPETAEAVLNSLIAEQLVAGSEKGKTKKVSITQAGREALEQLAEAVPQPPPPPPPKPPKKSAAELVAEKVHAKVAELDGEDVVTEKSLGKPGGKKATEAQTQAFMDTLAELLKAGKLYPHPGGNYGKRPAPTLAEVVRKEVQAKLDTAEGPFKPADLSKPKRGATAEEKQSHADALGNLIAELTAAKKLFPHPGGKYGQLAFVEPDYPDRDLREVYVLHQVFRATNHTITTADIELAFPGKGKPELKVLKAKYPHVAAFRGQGCFEMGAPATRQTLEQLVAAGDLRYTGEANGGEYGLTDAGAKRLEQARTVYPVLPPVGDPATPGDDAMRQKWEAFVLLRLTEAAGFTLGESAVFAGGYPKGSKLNEATAWVLYGDLAKAGHVAAHWNGTEGEYTLVHKGLRHLARLSFDGFSEVKIKGTALTALLSAARGGEKATATPTSTSPPPADLEAAVLDIIGRLLRERFSHLKMVPIHEVRGELARTHGTVAASHDALDPVLNRLDLTGKVRLVEIDDRSRATAEQLQASIAASSGLLFYIKEGR